MMIPCGRAGVAGAVLVVGANDLGLSVPAGWSAARAGTIIEANATMQKITAIIFCIFCLPD